MNHSYILTRKQFSWTQVMKFLKVILFVCFSYLTVESACWETLNPGDTIALIAPSSKPTSQAIETIKGLITAQGYVPVVYYDESASAEFDRSATREARRDALLCALRSDAKVIWSLRGGNGASGLFRDPQLFNEFRSTPPKLLVGFSDFTAVHLWANSIGWPSLHGIVTSFCLENQHIVNKETSIVPYFDILSGRTRECVYTLTCENDFAGSANIEGSSIIGGNLSLIQRAMGTPRQPNTLGKILFLEDIKELGRKTDEALSQLAEAGLIDELAAVIWGNFSGDASEQINITSAKDLWKEYLDERGIPFLSADCFGHDQLNMPLPFGTPARIAAGGMLTVKTNNA